jgi:malate dehydrogenase (oxaloacetate-decarboxylating)
MSTSGTSILLDPIRNRGTAFTEEERAELGLFGLLPPQVESLEQQAERAWRAFTAIERPDAAARDLARHINLRALQDTDETLFYRVLADHIGETLPIVYTPTVGAACQRFSHIYRRPRGLFVAYPDRDRLLEVIRNRPNPEVDVIVVTDGQRILGLGDQGVGGMGIPIGKLSLYTAVGGIDPARTLPIVLDVGTDDEDLRNDPEYLGWRHPRIGEAEYRDFVEAFVSAVEQELPHVLLQWEDFANQHAFPILTRYRDRLLTFNDDIQGTAAVVAGALVGGATVSGTRMADQRTVMLGGGSAGMGVADRLVQAMVTDGRQEDEARATVWVVDVGGLLLAGQDDLTDEQRRYAKTEEQLAAVGLPATAVADRGDLDLATVVAHVHPTTLIGLSTATNAFTEAIVRDMAAHVERPIIMPLSNPTSRSEADPQDLADWTDGKALVATGSPYPPVRANGKESRVAQANNVYVFPAMGLGAIAGGATRITEGMFLAAAIELGRRAPVTDDPTEPLLPAVEDLPATATAIAIAVAKQAVQDGVAPKRSDEELEQLVAAARWTPRYPSDS